MSLQGSKTYKIKLASGRILGPLDLARVRLLIAKNQITGVESAREYPDGEWQSLYQVPDLAALLVAKVSGELSSMTPQQLSEEPIANTDGKTAVLPGAAQKLPGNALVPLPESSKLSAGIVLDLGQPTADDEKTVMVGHEELQEELNSSGSRSDPQEADDDATRVIDKQILDDPIEIALEENEPEEDREQYANSLKNRALSDEKTVIFQRSTGGKNLPGKKPRKIIDTIRVLLIGLSIGYFGYDAFLSDSPPSTPLRQGPIRPKLPEPIPDESDPRKTVSDPNKSTQIYNEGIIPYLEDTVQGYRKAAEKFRLSASYDLSNVKAVAMLASSYLNLIDNSNKDENYFAVITKLIDMSRAKNVDLSETTIADVEFFIVVNKAEAAQNRIVEYTKSHQTFGVELFYYLALAYYERGDAASAARFLAQVTDDKVRMVKIFYLKGLVAEKLNDDDQALIQYQKAIQLSPSHAKSKLKLAYLKGKKGNLKEAEPYLEFLMKNINLLSPRDLAQAYYLHAQLAELYQKWDIALGDVERAVKLNSENHDYLLELYTLRAKAGDSMQSVQKQARMYYFLGEGEKLVHQGRYQEAMVPFLQARQANDQSAIPLIKIGDMFNYLHNVENAKTNYKLAVDRAPKNIQVLSKYIKTLLQSFEWEEAAKAITKLGDLPGSQSIRDKFEADKLQKQGRYVDAQLLYRKAMSRDLIDPEVYTAYANSLMSTHNFKDAPFFFALALRYDPLNIEATLGTAKCVAETESIERAISMLQDELKKNDQTRAEFLTAIAEFEIQKGDWDRAQKTINQAMEANPEYAESFRLQAKIHMNRENTEKGALDRALLAFKSFSERNPSDPSGYLERYQIFAKKLDFEGAKEELAKVYNIYPKYPKLHYYLGVLYVLQGNHRAAAEEFRIELANNSGSIQTLIAYGKELLELEKPQEALTQFTEAMKLDPHSSEAKQNAGWANFFLKNFQAAVTLLKAAAFIDKANPTIYKRLGLVYKDMNDMASACGAFKKYLEMEPDASDKGSYSQCF